MNITRVIHSTLLILTTLFLLCFSVPIVAQENIIELEATYPKVENTLPEAIFKFPISLTYRGEYTRDFDLQVIGPLAWDTYVTSGDEGVRVSVVKLKPNMEYPDHIVIVAAAPPSATSGEYKVTLIISSDTLQNSIDLTAVIIPRYSLDIIPRHLSHYVITADQDNHFTITIANNGTNELTNIRFSLDGPEGWNIGLTPNNILSLSSGISQDIQLRVKPPAEVNGRSYKITLTAKAAQAMQETAADYYFNVEEPQGSWMWVGGVIALIVISIFTYIFVKMSRKKEVT